MSEPSSTMPFEAKLLPPTQLSVASEKMRRFATQCDGSQENQLPSLPPAKPAQRKLSDRQQTAVNLLVMGQPVALAAANLGLHRATIFRWKSQDPRFVAELNRRRKEVYEVAENRLRCLLLKSLRVIDEELSDRIHPKERASAAFRLLPHMSPRRLPPPQGPMTVDEAVDAIARSRRARADGDIKSAITDEEREAVWRETDDDTVTK